MSGDENTKNTMPDMAVLGELVKLNLKFDDHRERQSREMSDLRKQVANDTLAMGQKFTETIGRIETLESASKHTGETARRAMKSASDLSEHVAATENAMKGAFDKVGDRVRAVEDMTREQTPMLREIRDEQIARRAREELAAEQAQKAREDEAKAIAERERLRAHRVKLTRIWVAAIVAIAGVGLPLLGSYYGSKQANQDAPPRAIVAPAH